MNRAILPLILIFLFSLYSCDDIIDCIVNVRPELPNKVLKEGVINQDYSDYLHTDIKNEPRDDDYEYYFDLEGNLPNGILMYVDFRDVYFEGIPLESGTFSFILNMYVDPPDDYDYDTGEYVESLCTDNTSKAYTIKIN